MKRRPALEQLLAGRAGVSRAALRSCQVHPDRSLVVLYQVAAAFDPITELADVDVHGMSRRTDLTTMQVAQALEALVACGLVKPTGDGSSCTLPWYVPADGALR